MSTIKIWIEERTTIGGKLEYYLMKKNSNVYGCVGMFYSRREAMLAFEAAKSGYPKSKIIAETTVKE